MTLTQPTHAQFESVASVVPSASALERDLSSGTLSRIAENESWRKEVHRPATSTHKWWAKRLGSVFRGIITAAVTPKDADPQVAYSEPTQLDGTIIFDPFAGSGTTIVEAAKLGAAAVGWDINPVATLVQRQAVQRWDMKSLLSAYAEVEGRCRAEIDRVHKNISGETVLYYFWVAVAACPECSLDTRLFSSHVFSQNAYPKRVPKAQIVCPECLDIIEGRYDFESIECAKGHTVPRKAAVLRGQMTCAAGHVSKITDALKGNKPSYEMYAKLVMTADGRKRYDGIDEFDRTLYQECSDRLEAEADCLVLPTGELADGENTRQALRWGFEQWSDFFNDRQLYSLGLLAKAITEIEGRAPEREALCALLSGTLEFNNMFCSFKGEGTGAVRHMFSHHILKPERTPLEAHPWGTPASSGSFSTLFKSRLLKANTYKQQPFDQVWREAKVERVTGLSRSIESSIHSMWPKAGLGVAEVYLASGNSAHTDMPDGCVDLVVTDPPYMDNVHYSELADFFHAWLRAMRPYEGYALDDATTRRAGEVQSPTPLGFELAITDVWKECHRVMKDDGLMAFTFHQARLSGWVALVRSLATAGFVVTAIQPVKGEMSTSVTKYGKEPSNLDSILVCRKRAHQAEPPAEQDALANRAMDLLRHLQTDGVEVGVGDVRSVVRGCVLAAFTLDPDQTDLDRLALTADERANSAVSMWEVQNAQAV